MSKSNNAAAQRPIALTSAIIACLFAGATHAQSTVGDIYGTASPSQTVQVQNVGSGAVRQVPVDQQGRYRVSSLPIGHYRVNVQADGQTLTTKEVDVVAGQSIQLNFVAEVAAPGTKNLEGVTVSQSAHGH